MAKSATSPKRSFAKPAVGRMSWSRRAEHVWAIGLIGVSEVTYYRWRREFGELQIEQVKRLKELELENSRLRKAVSDLTLDKLILQEAARRNC
jgi:putative transposase